MSSTIELTCPVCEHAVPFVVLANDTGNNKSLCRCPYCALRHLHAARTRDFATDAMYGGHTFSPEKATMATRSAARYLRDIRQLMPDNPVGTLLDLGAGLGYYSRAFAEGGVRVTSVEKDAYSLAFSQSQSSNLPVRIVDEFIDDFLAQSSGPFDIVLLRHVIEHLDTPSRTFSLISKVMHPRSVVIVETDNNRSQELVFHPVVKYYWRALYREEFGLSLAQILDLMPFPLGERQSHYWGFNLDNLVSFLGNHGLTALLRQEYALGDRDFWPNVKSLGRALREQPFDRGTIRYLLHHLNPRHRGAGLLVYAGMVSGSG